jgi:hypothetical protein
VYTNELTKSSFIYNPRGIADGATVNLTQADTNFEGIPPKFNVDDLEQVVADLAVRNAPLMEDGNYCCACSPYFLKDLRADDKFLEISRYPGFAPMQAMIPGATGMAPPQIPFTSYWSQGGLMQGQSMSLAGQSLMPKIPVGI